MKNQDVVFAVVISNGDNRYVEQFDTLEDAQKYYETKKGKQLHDPEARDSVSIEKWTLVLDEDGELIETMTEVLRFDWLPVPW
jgi:hypothetical protein